MFPIKSVVKKVLNVKPSVNKADDSAGVSKETYDILLRATEQGERIRKIEGLPRSGNPFGDILENRIDKGINHA